MKKIIYLNFLVLFFFNLKAQNINWSNPIEVAPSSFGNDYPRIVLNGNKKPLITWGKGKNIYFSKLEALGFTSPEQLNIEGIDAYVAGWTGADIAARNDTIYVCFMEQDWDGKSYILSSFDNGNNFNRPVLIENYPDSTSRFPSVTIDEQGNPIVGIMKMTTSGHDPHYVIRRSFDYGESFTTESNAGGWSGNSEACDCCPASIKAVGNTVALFYRDNLSNIRDIWATVSVDYGYTFTKGFAVDNNSWEIFGCPSSGPDGIIIEDDLYSVFLSENSSYLSKTKISNESIEYIRKLGVPPNFGSQNFPRIVNHNKAVAITWKGIDAGTSLHVSYTDDITSGTPFIQDTLYHAFFGTSDIAMSNDAIHVIWEDSQTGTIQYTVGTFGTTAIETTIAKESKIYPNPAQNNITINNHERYDFYTIYSINGNLVMSGRVKKNIDIAKLGNGNYIIELVFEKKIFRQKLIVSH